MFNDARFSILETFEHSNRYYMRKTKGTKKKSKEMRYPIGEVSWKELNDTSIHLPRPFASCHSSISVTRFLTCIKALNFRYIHKIDIIEVIGLLIYLKQKMLIVKKTRILRKYERFKK